MSQDMYYIGNQSGQTPLTQTVQVNKGGTGATELASGEILLGNGTDPVTTIATLPISKGGTGATELASGGILIGNGTSPVTTIATLPISKGGTGATTSANALTNLGIPIAQNNWTPQLICLLADTNVDPTYTFTANHSTYFSIGNLVFVTIDIAVDITNAGSGYAFVTLPLAPFIGGFQSYAFTVGIVTNTIDKSPATAIAENRAQIRLADSGGNYTAKWVTGQGRLLISGCYIKA